jgi:hypothetical protein
MPSQPPIVVEENGMSEDQLETAMNRGQRARELLENELLIEAFAKLEADYITGWRTTRVADKEAREKLWLALNIVGKVQDHLKTIVAGGKLAQTELRMRTGKA